MAIVQNTSSEIGDVILIVTDVPVIGVVTLTGFMDVTQGEGAGKTFKKEFRASIDGINFTSWQDLTTLNIQAIQVKPTDTLYLEYRYTRQGADPGGLLTFDEVDISGTFLSLSCPESFNNSIFAQFFGCHELECLNWTLNVLEKMYKKSGDMLSSYIRRGESGKDDTDFIEVWRGIIQTYAYIVCYARNFQDIGANSTLLKKYLNNVDVHFCEEDSLTTLREIQQNFYEEISFRGSSFQLRERGFNPEDIAGEVLRLICKQDCDEFIFGVTGPGNSGWWINRTSPTSFINADDEILNKSWEDTEEPQDLNNYPLIDNQSSGVTLFDDSGTQVIRIQSGGADLGVGVNIDPATDTLSQAIGDIDFDNDAIIVDPRTNYVIRFDVKGISNSDQLLFGLATFDKNNNFFATKSIVDGSNKVDFLFNTSLNQNNVWYSVFGIVYNYLEPNKSASDGLTNLGLGTNLRFSGELICKFIPVIGVQGTSEIYLKNIKMRILEAPYSLASNPQSSKSTQVWMKNRSTFDNNQIEQILKKKFVNYSSNLKAVFI